MLLSPSSLSPGVVGQLYVNGDRHSAEYVGPWWIYLIVIRRYLDYFCMLSNIARIGKTTGVLMESLQLKL